MDHYDWLFLAGMGLVAIGAGLIYLPAGVIVAGAGLIVLSLLGARGTEVGDGGADG